MNYDNSPRIYLPSSDESLPHGVKAILQDYEVPSVQNIDEGIEEILIFDDGKLKLKSLRPQLKNISPIYVDFEKGWKYHQKTFFRTSIHKEPLARALGLKKRTSTPMVIDATCGMGKDSLLMLFFKAKLHAIERSPWVALLIEDAVLRAKESSLPELQTAFKDNFTFTHGNAVELLPSIQEKYQGDIIYLDPMYSNWAHKKKALPNKNMQIFQNLVGKDEDSEQLLQTALDLKVDRVIVKRAINAPPLLPNATHSYEGKSTRYDMCN